MASHSIETPTYAHVKGMNDTSVCNDGCSLRVCGRVRAYQVGETNAFRSSNESIDGDYVDGVSLTHSISHTHGLCSVYYNPVKHARA